MRKINTVAATPLRVFLGGTCNNSAWRDNLCPKLDLGTLSVFNPQLPAGVKWDDAHQQQEREERERADVLVYCITPLMTGVYSIAEAVEDAITRPRSTVFCWIPKDGDATFTESQCGSLKQVAAPIERRGGTICSSLEALAERLNSWA